MEAHQTMTMASGRDKTLTLEEAVSRVDDGMTVGIGGWASRRKPMALVRELLRSPVKDLTIVSYGGPDVGMLCAAGKVRKLIFAFVSLDVVPIEPWFRRVRQAGAVEVMELDEGMLMLGLMAAGMKLPFIPTPVGLGTDILVNNPDLHLVTSPYDDTGKEWVAMPALELDVALVHVDRADRRGVCRISGPDHYMDEQMVRAAKASYVSCDELVPTSILCASEESDRTVFWERSQTTGVVHLPGGAHPSSCAPLYGPDPEHLRTYSESAAGEHGWEQYFERYLAGGERDYLEAVGGYEHIKQLPPEVY